MRKALTAVSDHQSAANERLRIENEITLIGDLVISYDHVGTGNYDTAQEEADAREAWSGILKHIRIQGAEIERLRAERDAAFNDGVEAAADLAFWQDCTDPVVSRIRELKR